MAPKEDPLPPGWENLDRSVADVVKTLDPPYLDIPCTPPCLIRFDLVSIVLYSSPLSL